MENASSAAARYSRGAIVLHWLIAVLIVLNFVVAWTAEEMSKADEAAMMANHKAIGITVLVLTVLRVIWRVAKKPPPLVETLKSWEAALSRVVHGVLYFLMLALPLSGWAMSSAFSKGKGVSLFGLFDAPALPVGYDKPTIGMYHDMHEIFATLMLVLVALHVGGALKHHFIDKDGTMRRMVPWLR